MPKTLKIFVMFLFSVCLLVPQSEAGPGPRGRGNKGRGRPEKRRGPDRPRPEMPAAPQYDSSPDRQRASPRPPKPFRIKEDKPPRRSRGKKKGWKDDNPPGWAQGKKKGWKDDTPPGWAKWGSDKKEAWDEDLSDSRRRAIERSREHGMSDEQSGEVADLLEKAIRHGYDARDAFRTVAKVLDDVASEKLDSMDAIRRELDTLLKLPRIKERIREEEASREPEKKSWFQRLLGN